MMTNISVLGHCSVPTQFGARSWQTLDPPKRESSSGPQWSSLRLSRLGRDPLDRGANFPGHLDSKATEVNVTSLCWMKLLKWQQIDHESVLLLRFIFFQASQTFDFTPWLSTTWGKRCLPRNGPRDHAAAGAFQGSWPFPCAEPGNATGPTELGPVGPGVMR